MKFIVATTATIRGVTRGPNYWIIEFVSTKKGVPFWVKYWQSSPIPPDLLDGQAPAAAPHTTRAARVVEDGQEKAGRGAGRAPRASRKGAKGRSR